MTTSRRLILALATLALTTAPVRAATFVVTNNADSGPGSLRQAIESANATAAWDVIAFALSIGQLTITPLTSLPILWNPVFINGTSQPGYSGVPIVEIDGHLTDGSGFQVYGGGSSIRGLTINRFPYRGIVLASQSNSVSACHIRTNRTGTVALGTGSDGILIGNGASTNGVGGVFATDRNVISGNTYQGVLISSDAGTGNNVVGNYIGTTATGDAALPNGADGIRVISSQNVIGGLTPGHLVSGNLRPPTAGHARA